MSNMKDILNDFMIDINNLNISKKKKEEIIDSVCNILLEFETSIVNKYSALEDRVNKLEKILNDEMDDFDYEMTIKCPYCNKDVDIYMDKDKMDVKCPSCGKIIELEW